MISCSKCGTALQDDCNCCPECGCRTDRHDSVSAPNPAGGNYPPGYVPKHRIVYILLGLFLGGLGAHEFYRGETRTGWSLLAGNASLWIWLIAGIAAESAIYIFPLIVLPIFEILILIAIFRNRKDSKGFDML